MTYHLLTLIWESEGGEHDPTSVLATCIFYDVIFSVEHGPAEIYWQSCEFCIDLAIYLVNGGAVICGPLVSGQRQTYWLLGY